MTLDGWDDELQDWADAVPGHTFDQHPGAGVVVCKCGKWMLHHVHTGDRAACTCDECNVGRVLRP